MFTCMIISSLIESWDAATMNIRAYTRINSTMWMHAYIMAESLNINVVQLELRRAWQIGKGGNLITKRTAVYIVM